ncbi:MAG: heat-shock protein [Pirellulaceae bacterium]|nr:MAG: heat-shock protein [Pirellulaceae bacterium]
MAETLVKREQPEVAQVERTRSGVTYSPRFDIFETDDELLLFGDLPGVAPENLDVRFENDMLTIYGRVEPRHAQDECVYGEYGIGDFYRSFTIGEAIDTGRITAELKNGVLTVHLPKTEAVKPRRIEVKAG